MSQPILYRFKTAKLYYNQIQLSGIAEPSSHTLYYFKVFAAYSTTSSPFQSSPRSHPHSLVIMSLFFLLS